MARKSKQHPNEGILNPETGVLMITCATTDLILEDDGGDRVTLLVDNFYGGIEIIHPNSRIWWPV